MSLPERKSGGFSFYAERCPAPGKKTHCPGSTGGEWPQYSLAPPRWSGDCPGGSHTGIAESRNNAVNFMPDFRGKWPIGAFEGGDVRELVVRRLEPTAATKPF